VTLPVILVEAAAVVEAAEAVVEEVVEEAEEAVEEEEKAPRKLFPDLAWKLTDFA